ncbi:MAG: hypothetical protein K2V38_10880, partial [Gemmataceae bacterium]|nr:hypothetical protein [Gemmataceae bacterium]
VPGGFAVAVGAALATAAVGWWLPALAWAGWHLRFRLVRRNRPNPPSPDPTGRHHTDSPVNGPRAATPRPAGRGGEP